MYIDVDEDAEPDAIPPKRGHNRSKSHPGKMPSDSNVVVPRIIGARPHCPLPICVCSRAEIRKKSQQPMGGG